VVAPLCWSITLEPFAVLDEVDTTVVALFESLPFDGFHESLCAGFHESPWDEPPTELPETVIGTLIDGPDTALPPRFSAEFDWSDFPEVEPPAVFDWSIPLDPFAELLLDETTAVEPSFDPVPPPSVLPAMVIGRLTLPSETPLPPRFSASFDCVWPACGPSDPLPIWSAFAAVAPTRVIPPAMRTPRSPRCTYACMVDVLLY
jgi:hypothetical protein